MDYEPKVIHQQMDETRVSLTEKLPAPEEISRRIESCQDELAALRKLLRVSLTAHRAERARQRRYLPGGNDKPRQVN